MRQRCLTIANKTGLLLCMHQQFHICIHTIYSSADVSVISADNDEQTRGNESDFDFVYYSETIGGFF